MEIKQKPPTDLEIAEAMGPSPLVGMLSTHREIERNKHALYKRTALTFDDHRTATTPPEPIAVHGWLGNS